MTLYIYKIFFEEEPQVLYVGKTKNPQVRAWAHRNIKQNNKKTKRNNWIVDRLRLGWELQFEIIDTAETEDEINDKERYWIKNYRDRPSYIVKNSTEGGDGVANPSEEVRLKISLARKGAIYSEETRKRMSDSAKGRKASTETRRKLSEMRKGEKHPGAIYTYELTDPQGNKHITNCMSTFCRTHGIQPSNMSHVIAGRLKHTKGWTGRKVQ